MTFDEYVDGRLGALLRHATAITCDPHLAQDVVQEWHQHLEDPSIENPGAITLTLDLEADQSIDGRSREVTVNGAPGWLTPPEAEVQQVVWPVGNGLSVRVEARHLDDGWTVVQEVARSVELEYMAGLEIPMAFGHLQPDLGRVQRLTVEPDGDRWVATLSVLEERASVLEARFGAHVASPFEPGSPQTELRGRPGYVRVQPGAGGGAAFVTLESGLNLEVSSPGNSDPITGADLVEMTNMMTIGPAPYVGWLWHR